MGRNNRAENFRVRVACLLTSMARGALLYSVHTRDGTRFALSDGTSVRSDVAQAAICDPRVHAADPGLFKGTPQSWKYDEVPH